MRVHNVATHNVFVTRARTPTHIVNVVQGSFYHLNVAPNAKKGGGGGRRTTCENKTGQILADQGRTISIFPCPIIEAIHCQRATFWQIITSFTKISSAGITKMHQPFRGEGGPLPLLSYLLCWTITAAESYPLLFHPSPPSEFE